MRQYATLRRWLAKISQTPLHPQWFAFRGETVTLAKVAKIAEGDILDVGAGEQKIRDFLPAFSPYISLDYYQTAAEWYKTRPTIFGDAHALPLASDQFDTVILLDVMEHLRHPIVSLAEIGRVLRPNGKLILQVPFLYPLHDMPFDFRRWTESGLRATATQAGFAIAEITSQGHPLETTALLRNLAWSKTILNWLQTKNPLILLAPLLPLFVFSNNLFSWLCARLSRTENFMPRSYFAVLVKK
jgi:SAM-dependent methyltransferase